MYVNIHLGLSVKLLLRFIPSESYTDVEYLQKTKNCTVTAVELGLHKWFWEVSYLSQRPWNWTWQMPQSHVIFMEILK
jgi:hypothetical protein